MQNESPGSKSLTGTIDRRDYLKVTGASLAGVAFGAGMARGADYDTVKVSAGEHKSIRLGSGDTYENKLIDITASGASVKFHAEGDGWAIRNVGIKGQHPGGNYVMTPAVSSKDGEGLIENFWAGDGQKARTGKGFCWVNHNHPHRGTITFRNVYIEGFIDNAIYGTPSSGGTAGVINLENSIVKNNNISNFRVGATDGRTCHVRNSVIDGTQSGTPPCGVGCSSPGAVNPRGIWAWNGTVKVVNSDVNGSSPRVEKDGGNIISENSRFGDSANTDRVPEGVPETPQAAASGASGTVGGGTGGGSTGGGPSGTGSNSNQETDLSAGKYPQLLLVGDTSTGLWGTAAEYTFTVDGEIKKSSAWDGVIDDADTISDGTTVEGTIEGSPDAYRFNGEITEFEMDGQAPIYLNHRVVSPDEVASRSGTPDLPNSVTIHSDGGGTANYAIDVDGTIEAGSNAAEDETRDGHAQGHVGPQRGTDTFYFEGDLTNFTLDGPATVFLNGEEIDPSKIEDADLNSRTNKLIISNPDGTTEFSFLVDGTVDQTDESTLFDEGSTPDDTTNETGNTSSPDSIYTNVSTETNNTGGGSTHTEISSETKMTNGEASGDVDVNTSGDGSTDVNVDTNIPDENFDGPTTDGNTTAPNSTDTGTGTDTDAGTDGSDIPAGLPTSAKQETDNGVKVTGSVGGGKIVFEYTGKLSDFSYTGNATVAVKFE